MADRIRVPFDEEPRPSRLVAVPVIDTGGAWRPAHRPQDPAQDPAEPFGGESSSAGTDHGWSNCTMSAGAVAYAYEAHAAGHDAAPWGGHLRHSGQPDMSGGTDLYDLRDAWRLYGGLTLTIRSGAGWGAVQTAHAEGRAVVIQGEGDVPGSGTFTGGHACTIGPETSSDGSWLWSDPCTSGWQFVTPSSIRSWAERLSQGVYFAVSRPIGEAMADIHVQDATPKLVDMPAGIVILNLGDYSKRTTMPSTYVGVASPFQAADSPGGTRVRAVVYTGLLLGAYVPELKNIRDVPGADDDDAVRAARDAEWQKWLLAGNPGE